MGDHAIGREMDRMAQAIMLPYRTSDTYPDEETARSFLDRICTPHKGRDAEFEAEDPDNPGCVHPLFGFSTDPHPQADLGTLILLAFGDLEKHGGIEGLYARYFCSPHLEELNDPDNPTDLDPLWDLWSEEVYAPFRDAYNFC